MAAMLKRRAAERAAEAAAAKAARRATEDARATERAAEAELAAETARRATERAAAAAAEAAQAEQAARGKKTLAPDDRGASSSGGSDSDSMPELAAVNDSSSSDEPADRPPPRQSPQPKKPAKKKPNPKRKAAKRRGGPPGARGLYMQSCVHTCPRLPTGGDAQEPGEARFAELRKAMEASPTYFGDGSYLPLSLHVFELPGIRGESVGTNAARASRRLIGCSDLLERSASLPLKPGIV